MFTLAGLSLRALHLGFAFRCAPRLAVVVQLDEASCEDESGRTGLVADAQIFLPDAELLRREAVQQSLARRKTIQHPNLVGWGLLRIRAVHIARNSG